MSSLSFLRNRSSQLLLVRPDPLLGDSLLDRLEQANFEIDESLIDYLEKIKRIFQENKRLKNFLNYLAHLD